MKKADKDVNNGQLSRTPPAYLGMQAKVVWRRLVPFLEENTPVKRIDSGLMEQYASQYEIYRNAYEHIQENGADSRIRTDYKYEIYKIRGVYNFS